jgi:ABC-2 type transport system permease protein
MTIFLHELKMKLRSVLVWSLSITGLLTLFASLFGTVAEEMDLLNEVLANYPPELLAAFGWDNMDMGTVLGFFAFAFSFIQIMISIQAANYGYSLVSVEERELTADFLLAKPLPRRKILTNKLLAALAALWITFAVLCIVSVIAVNGYADGRSYDGGTLAKVLSSVLFLQLFFLMGGLAVSLLLKKVPSVISISLGTVFGMYVLAAFGSGMGEDTVDYLTPFKHFEATEIVRTGQFDLPKISISIAVIVIAMIASYMLYQRRDIPTV